MSIRCPEKLRMAGKRPKFPVNGQGQKEGHIHHREVASANPASQRQKTPLCEELAKMAGGGRTSADARRFSRLPRRSGDPEREGPLERGDTLVSDCTCSVFTVWVVVVFTKCMKGKGFRLGNHEIGA